MSLLALSIETVPDVAGLRKVHALPESLADAEVAEFAFQKGRAAVDAADAPDTLPPHLHRVIGIAYATHDSSGFSMFSLSAAGREESALIQGFFDVLAERSASLECWSASDHDMRVLQQRGLIHGVSTGMYAQDQSRRIDLANELVVSTANRLDERSDLDELSYLCGFPAPSHLTSTDIWKAWRAANHGLIDAHCEMRAVSALLVLSRFMLLRGHASRAQHDGGVGQIRLDLASREKEHWRRFLSDWPTG